MLALTPAMGNYRNDKGNGESANETTPVPERFPVNGYLPVLARLIPAGDCSKPGFG